MRCRKKLKKEILETLEVFDSRLEALMVELDRFREHGDMLEIQTYLEDLTCLTHDAIFEITIK